MRVEEFRKRVIRTSLQLLLAAGCGASLQSFAASIAVDFLGDGPEDGSAATDQWKLTSSDVAGVVPQANWNNIETPDGGDDLDADRGISGVLVNQDGAATQVQLAYSGNDAWNTSAFALDTPDAKMMKGLLKQFGSEAMTLAFTNLSAGSYDVYVYGNVDGGPANAEISIGGRTNYWAQPASFDDFGTFLESASTDANAPAEGNYVKFTGVAPQNGAISIRARHLGGGNALGIAGIQLVTTGTFPAFTGPTAFGATTQVQDVNVHQGSEAAFSFVATNNASPAIPTIYQWYKNGQLAPGVTGPFFTFLAGPGDAGAKVHAVASVAPQYNPGNASLTSSTGVVTLLPGTIYTNGLKVEFFAGATREDVEAGNVPPSSNIFVISRFELPVNDEVDDYTRRVSGYFIPPTAGNYVFFISADDDSDLFLSTNEDPANKRLIAQEEAWSGSRDWVSAGPNSSVSQKRSDQWSPDEGATVPFANGIPLAAGQRYYIEAVHHQGAGGNNLAVTYKLTSEPDPADDDAPRLDAANRNIAFISRPTTSLAWAIQPSSTNVTAGQVVTLTSRAATDSEFQPVYQWFRNGVAVTNSNSATYSFPAGAAENNTQWHVVARTADGTRTITSSAATVTVRSSNNRQATITFSDQAGNDVPADPNPYTDAQGLPNGVTMTLTSFNNWNGDNDHTATEDDYLLYGNGDAEEPPAITFNVPVEVPSIWVTTGPFGSVGSATLAGYLNGVEQFAYTIQERNTFVEVTVGAGKLIDSIRFTDYGDSEIDDITVIDPRVAAPLVTFSEQVGNDVPANPNPLTDAHGLPSGVTATLRSFNNWNGNADHTPSADNYLLYGNGDAAEDPAILFNKPVEVPSLWVSTGPFGTPGSAKLTGYLNGVARWSFTIPSRNTFVEVTAGADKAIDSIVFSDYGDSFIDDISVVEAGFVPSPILTFSDQIGNDVLVNPSTYTDAHGLPIGVTATLTGFSNWNGSDDHTGTDDDYLLYGAEEPMAITFNQPVEVPSIWVGASAEGQPGVATLTGYLNNVPQWTHTLASRSWTEVTAGAGKAIDRIQFTNYIEGWIDDVTVRPAPTGAPQLTISRTASGVTLSWTGSGTLEQTSSLSTPNWQAAPSQANPQIVATSGDRMRFYRIRQ